MCCFKFVVFENILLVQAYLDIYEISSEDTGYFSYPKYVKGCFHNFISQKVREAISLLDAKDYIHVHETGFLQLLLILLVFKKAKKVGVNAFFF